MILRQEIF